MNNKTLLENLRCIPDFPKKGINFRDVTTLFGNPECLQIMEDELYDIYKNYGITKIVGIESRGFVMASALAVKLHAGVVLCRKPGKLPGDWWNHESGLQSGQKIQPEKDLCKLLD